MHPHNLGLAHDLAVLNKRQHRRRRALRAADSGSSAYSGSSGNLSRISFDSDNVFCDGVDTQMATISGNLAAGCTASLQLAISV